MLKKMIYMAVLMIFIIIILGCAGTHKEFMLKRKLKPAELPKDKIVNVLLKDGSTFKLSIISLEGTKLIGMTEEIRHGKGLVPVTKDIDVKDIQSMWIENTYAEPVTSGIVYAIVIGLPTLFGLLIHYID
jgi:hypothetical protein